MFKSRVEKTNRGLHRENKNTSYVNYIPFEAENGLITE